MFNKFSKPNSDFLLVTGMNDQSTNQDLISMNW